MGLCFVNLLIFWICLILSIYLALFLVWKFGFHWQCLQILRWNVSLVIKGYCFLLNYKYVLSVITYTSLINSSKYTSEWSSSDGHLSPKCLQTIPKVCSTSSGINMCSWLIFYLLFSIQNNDQSPAYLKEIGLSTCKLN